MLELKGNKNYAASIVTVNKFEPIPGSDRIQIARVFGNSVIVSKDVKPGEVMIYFPVGTQLSHPFVAYNNLYRKPEMGNRNPEAKGFFDANRLVRCLKLRGAKSEGVLLPLSCLGFCVFQNDDPLLINMVGTDFDTAGGNQICCKYIPRCNPASTKHGQKERKARPEDNIVDGQFRFHYDTDNLRRNIHRISEADIVAVTWKVHGTSIVLANLLVKKKLTWKEKVAKWLGIPVIEADYGLIWSSRRVVKGVDGEGKKDAVHYYDTDVWGDWAKKIGHLIPKGFTLYAEIVGYTPDGRAIQKFGREAFDYGCAIGESRLMVYRITQTNADGSVVELSWPQVQSWCEENGVEHVPHIFYGNISEYHPFTSGTLGEWQESLLAKLEQFYVKDQDSEFCNNVVPEEGIVVRREYGLRCEAFKLKSFRFLSGESEQLDTGVSDMETDQSEGGE